VKNKTINIGAVSIVAKGLKELKDSIVFVGGSIISLYADREEMLSIHIHPLMIEERLPILTQKITQIINL